MSNKKSSSIDKDKEVEVVTTVEIEVGEPPMYKVYLLNDDYTPMDYVVDVLMKFFDVSEPEATMIMLQVHKSGKGCCGVYTRDIAEAKVIMVNNYSRDNDQPLLCQMEEA